MKLNILTLFPLLCLGLIGCSSGWQHIDYVLNEPKRSNGKVEVKVQRVKLSQSSFKLLFEGTQHYDIVKSKTSKTKEQCSLFGCETKRARWQDQDYKVIDRQEFSEPIVISESNLEFGVFAFYRGCNDRLSSVKATWRDGGLVVSGADGYLSGDGYIAVKYKLEGMDKYKAYSVGNYPVLSCVM